MPQHEQKRAAAMVAALLALGGTALDTRAQAPAASTQSAGQASYDIAAGALAPALRSLAATAGVPLTFTADQTDGLATAGLQGRYTATQAFEQLLAGTGLQAVVLGNGGYVLRKRPASDVPATTLPAVTVSGRRLYELPDAFAGGQVARGAQLGLLGNADYMDAPFSIVSYTAQTVRDQQATSVAEVLTTSDSSVRASIGSGNRYDALTIRGFRVDNDELALNGLYGLVPAYRINPDPVERIELLKGPGAFLNGMLPWGSVGGNVNIVTKRADDAPLTRFTAEYASDSRWGGHLDLGRRFGDQNQFGLRLNGAFRGGEPRIDGQSTQNGAGSLGLDFRNDRLRLSADIIYQDDWMRAAARGYNVAPGVAVPDAPDPKINLAQRFDKSSAQSLTGLTRAEYDLSDRVTLFGAVGANRFDYDKREAPGATILNVNGDASSTSTHQHGKTQAVSGEAGIRARIETGPVSHQLVVSGNQLDTGSWQGQTRYAAYQTNIYRPVRLDDPGAPIAHSPEYKTSESTLRSLAVADTLSVRDGLVQLTLGARRQSVDTRSFSATGETVNRYKQSATTPSASLVLRPADKWSLYANYIEALTAGASAPVDAANADEVFAPYRSKQYEIGAKADYGTFGATLALFRISVPGGIVDPISKIYSLDGEQRNQGVELNGFGELAKGVRLMGGVTWLDAEQRKTQGGTNDGKRAVGAPNLQANLSVEWDTPFVPGLTLLGRAIHTGRGYVSADNTQHVPAWTRLDAGGRYTTRVSGKEVVLRATVTNLTDKRYWEANPSGYLISGMPRTLWLSVSTDF
ncbi:TonB-dependent receptor [Achromobacter sp. DH1f]|uniref:TonB-dependent receptor n=1 Tax=Achromobacter sp. DH1f TaxID=1397275 RepID=UPI00046A1843|nr:TonB-dependent receptor [Achromobacter sp. DH1f]